MAEIDPGDLATIREFVRTSESVARRARDLQKEASDLRRASMSPRISTGKALRRQMQADQADKLARKAWAEVDRRTAVAGQICTSLLSQGVELAELVRLGLPLDSMPREMVQGLIDSGQLVEAGDGSLELPAGGEVA